MRIKQKVIKEELVREEIVKESYVQEDKVVVNIMDIYADQDVTNVRTRHLAIPDIQKRKPGRPRKVKQDNKDGKDSIEIKKRGRPRKVKAVGKQYAILVGISDYRFISDLEYCDEDVHSWYSLFKKKNFEIQVYGDMNINNYPKYDGLATETNVRKAIKNLVMLLKPEDTLAIITSGHGSGDGKGNSFLCMYDCSSRPVGSYTDKEFYSDVMNCKAKLFIFFDNCFSGGMLDEFKNKKNVFLTSTCTENGFGYDDAKSKNGAWTQCFLEDTLAKQDLTKPIEMNMIFNLASAKYSYQGGDKPMKACNEDKFYL